VIVCLLRWVVIRTSLGAWKKHVFVTLWSSTDGLLSVVLSSTPVGFQAGSFLSFHCYQKVLAQDFSMLGFESMNNAKSPFLRLWSKIKLSRSQHASKVARKTKHISPDNGDSRVLSTRFRSGKRIWQHPYDLNSLMQWYSIMDRPRLPKLADLQPPKPQMTQW